MRRNFLMVRKTGWSQEDLGSSPNFVGCVHPLGKSLKLCLGFLLCKGIIIVFDSGLGWELSKIMPVGACVYWAHKCTYCCYYYNHDYY